MIKTKICKACGEEKSINEFYIMNKHKGYRYSRCRDCHKELTLDRYNKLPSSRPSQAYRRASSLMGAIRHRDPSTDLTTQWIADKIEKGVCEVTGIPFVLKKPTGAHRSPYTPSVDQIIPGKGYTKDNVQIVIWMYNAAKGEWGHEDVMRMVKALG